ncbi:MAG: Gfo/Idh/MocA family oxidoreductase [Lentisphaeria bacterium]|nr:Gfo/Idh/MocA family oxidoreductase [Lentisphaeria bacterium]
MSKKRYVQVGTGGRCEMYLNAICKDYKDTAELVGLCDSNSIRMQYWNDYLQKTYGIAALPMYKAHDFDKMIEEIKPDVVIVTSMDRTHHKYICRAMELGCDVISEKPMTVDTEKCQQIIDTIKETGKHLTVTFNYRYTPHNTKVKEIIQSGAIGEITSIHFEWLLDTCHGADYFRRWHRNKNNSGGLLVHKATHHFDLINWWIESYPETVFAMGDLKFYGKENAEKRGVTEFYSRARDNEAAAKDPFALHVKDTDERLLGLYYNAEKEDGYFRDQSVFGDGISIEDNMGVIVRYQNKAIMTYSLNAHCPYEGYRVCFNGTKGRLEFNMVESAHQAGALADFNEAPGHLDTRGYRVAPVPSIILQKHWSVAEEITYEKGVGGHGGGDVRLLDDLFIGVKEDPYHHAADYRDGAKSILTGIAANIAIKSGQPVDVSKLIKF